MPAERAAVSRAHEKARSKRAGLMSKPDAISGSWSAAAMPAPRAGPWPGIRADRSRRGDSRTGCAASGAGGVGGKPSPFPAAGSARHHHHAGADLGRARTGRRRPRSACRCSRRRRTCPIVEGWLVPWMR
jgi:hypothetical protein